MTSGNESGPDCSRPPLRRDAERNRQRILAAAAEVFTQRGLEVSLDEVARHAGVGIGTVYRRFTDKEELVRTLFTERIDELAAIAERALEVPDPWEGLVSFLDEWASALTGDLGLRDLLMFATHAQDRASYARRTFAPLVTALVDRAKASGQARADLCPTDIPFIALMLSAAAEYAHESRPEIWRRYLTLLIDGMHASRDAITPLPVPALLPQEMERTMVRHARRRR